jgi:hypothetical protein
MKLKHLRSKKVQQAAARSNNSNGNTLLNNASNQCVQTSRACIAIPKTKVY